MQLIPLSPLQVNAMQLAMRWQLLADGLITRAPKMQRAKPRRRSSLIDDSFLQERPASEPLSHSEKKRLAPPALAAAPPRRRAGVSGSTWADVARLSYLFFQTQSDR